MTKMQILQIVSLHYGTGNWCQYVMRVQQASGRGIMRSTSQHIDFVVVVVIFRPPELLLGTTKYGPAVDMWSVGCIFAELLHGKPIFPGKDEVSEIQCRIVERN